AFHPLRANPALLFQPVQRRIEGSLLHLQHLAGNLLDAFGNRPAVHRLQRDGAQDEEVERALYQIIWFAHTMTVYTTRLSTVKVSPCFPVRHFHAICSCCPVGSFRARRDPDASIALCHGGYNRGHSVRSAVVSLFSGQESCRAPRGGRSAV